VTPDPSLPAPLAPYLPDAATDAAPGHGLLAGSRLLVVGGGQQTYGQTEPPTGIGRAISILAAREGAAVAVADLDHDAAQATVDRISSEGGTAHAITGDASDPSDAARILTGAATALAGLDALVLNTGIAAGFGLTETTAADWDRVMAVNVRAHFLALQAAVTILEPGSAITLTSSTATRVVSTTDIPAYTTSKAALEGLCAYAAKEYAPRRIRVNIVMAGLIDTSLGRLATQFRPERAATPIPLGRQGTAWDIAAVTVFLLSDTASYITAATIPVDGGLSTIH
jgi:NAD(P)-dependent dehydrogenase (short-subunit alcohol dehydrogenase family)